MQPNSISPTFCILPWIHLATYTNGDVSTCCIAPQMRDVNLNSLTLHEIWNHPHFRNTRLKMLKGEKIKRCEYCYQQEASGLPSHRTDENQIWFSRIKDEGINKLIKNTTADGTLSIQPSTLDLRPGNRCNLKCLICSPVESTTWYNDAKKLSQQLVTNAKDDWKFKHNAASADYGWYSKDKFLNHFFDLLPNIKHIIWGGGEPLLLQEHDQFLEYAIEKGYAKNIELRYHTNGTIIEPRHINYWKHFKHVQVMLSIDGIGELNYFLRYPANWNQIKKSLEILDTSPDNIEPQILVTVSALNIHHLPKISDWILSQKYKKIGKQNHHGLFHPGILFWPPYLSVTILPQPTKDVITKKISEYVQKIQNPQANRFLAIVEHMNSKDDSCLLPQTIDYLQQLDQIRKTNYLQAFPHLT